MLVGRKVEMCHQAAEENQWCKHIIEVKKKEQMKDVAEPEAKKAANQATYRV